jgi:hypothetical protein
LVFDGQKKCVEERKLMVMNLRKWVISIGGAVLLGGLLWSVPAYAAYGELIFQSGFEGSTTRTTTSAQIDDLTGTDTSKLTRNNWVTDLEDHPQIGNFRLYYESGNTGDRKAEIIQESSTNTNKVLHYWLKNATTPDYNFYKGRIQTDIYNDEFSDQETLDEMYYKVRMKLDSDVQQLESLQKKIDWLTLAEFWNQPTWDGSPKPFRVTLGLNKEAPTSPGQSRPLYFHLSAENYASGVGYSEIWNANNKTFQIEYDKWMTMEVYYKKGNNTTGSKGRIYLAVTPEGGSRQVVFDVYNFTHNSTDTNPVGLSHFNPMKLYTSDEVINHVRNSGIGNALQVYWDDFELWNGWPSMIEAEAMRVGTTSGDAVSDSADSSCSRGYCKILSSNAVGDYMNLFASVPKDGLYDIKVGVKKWTNRGRFQMSIDGLNIGSSQDLYSSTVEYTELTIVNNYQLYAGERRFKFYVTGTSASGHQIAIDYIKLVPKN